MDNIQTSAKGGGYNEAVDESLDSIVSDLNKMSRMVEKTQKKFIKPRDYGASDDKQSNRVISEMDESFSRTNIFGSVNRSIISNEFDTSLSDISSIRFRPARDPSQMKYKFKNDPDEWRYSDNCFISGIKFGMFTKRYHCRLCGKSVCKAYSNNQIKGNRVCDVCFYKHKHKEGEIKRREMLRRMEFKIKAYVTNVKRLRERVLQKEKWRSKIQEELLRTEATGKKKINSLTDTIKNIKEILKTKREERDSLELQYKKNGNYLRETNLQIKEIESKIKMLGVAVDMLQREYEIKKARKQALKAHLEDLRTIQESFGGASSGGIEDQIKLNLAEELLRKSALLLEQSGKTLSLNLEKLNKEIKEMEEYGKRVAGIGSLKIDQLNTTRKRVYDEDPREQVQTLTDLADDQTTNG